MLTLQVFPGHPLPTLRSSVCAYTLLRRVLIHADCKWPSPTPSTTLPLYEMFHLNETAAWAGFSA